jgi:ribokinase
VSFIARIGADPIGGEALRALDAEHVRTDLVIRDPDEPTGTAWIVVDDRGENSIVVASGANARLSPADIRRGEAAIARADVVLMQLETPLDAVAETLAIASRHGVRTILNPAPALPLPHEMLSRASIITPNEIEAEMLTGIRIDGEESLDAASQRLIAAGIGTVILTLGSRGVYVASGRDRFRLPAFRVQVVDTTAAGDVFNGCLAAHLDPAGALRPAVLASNAAAALSVMKLGAQDSAPSRDAIAAFLERQPQVMLLE